MGAQLCLRSSVTIDLRERIALARRLLDRSTDGRAEDVSEQMVAALSEELLPDWFEDWLLLERDRWNQLRLHALEALAERLLEAERFVEAVEAALAAVWAEPLRESPNRLLIRIHAAEGNWSEAMAQYGRYRQILGRELRAAPTAQMEELMRVLTPR
jgi:DNA-binding SARP family transcriptional activator